MSQIVREVFDAFRAADVSEDLAEAAAGAIAGREDLASKLDVEHASSQLQGELAQVGVDLKADTAALRADFAQAENALRAEIAQVDANRQADVAGLRAELARVEADLKSDLKMLKFGYGPAILGLLIKLTFFP